ncbi:MAG: aminotransferase class I/II-fold pyridoxal phosphate-dependent enzyme [Bradymonadales bacterium]|nr:MAG: aminotransferase class I/II-fold pyridoxal phosphate-dependent enzyme [Bradymonadales bacterium]
MQEILVNSQLSNSQQSSTVLINQRVKDLRQEGREVYHFGFGQSPFEVHPSIQKALCDNAHQKSYLPTLGLPELRQAIAAFMANHFSYHYSPDHIVIGPGSKQLLYQAALAIEGPIILPAPTWVSYVPQAEITGKQIFICQTSKANHYKITAEQLENVCSGLDHRQKILVINNPNNPSGTVYHSQELKELAEVCRQNRVIVLSDEIYAFIQFDSESEIGGFARYYPEGSIVTGGLSKAFSAGGYRLGFIAVPDHMKDLVTALGVISSQTYTSVSAPIQYAAVEAYQNPDVVEYAKECSRIHSHTTRYLFDRMIDLGADGVRPEGAFYLFPDFDRYRHRFKELGLGSSPRLCHYLLDKHRVAVLPASSFYYPSEVLAFRMSSVDFSGEEALKAYRAGETLDFSFIENHCPNLKKGCDEIAGFVQEKLS